MKIPKHIENAIEQRAKHAERFNHYDYELSEWLDRKGIIVETCDSHGGVESVVNPWESARRIRECILLKGE